jgi:hypothetical protein
MKMDAIMKAIGKAEGRGMAEETLENLPAEGMPTDLPAEPDTESTGPPDDIPPVETGEAPGFDDLTGLPFISMENTPDVFPAEPENNDEASDILDFLFM